MMQHEFEALAGYKVSTDDYKKIIEPMYMATDLNKADFVACINKKRFAMPTKEQRKKQIIRQMRAEATHLAETCGHYTDYESEHRVEDLAHEYLKVAYGIDWYSDLTAYAYILREYEFPSIGRGCSYPKTVVFGFDNKEVDRIALVK